MHVINGSSMLVFYIKCKIEDNVGMFQLDDEIHVLSCMYDYEDSYVDTHIETFPFKLMIENNPCYRVMYKIDTTTSRKQSSLAIIVSKYEVLFFTQINNDSQRTK